MLLAIDIGNTNTVVGIFNGKKLLSHFRVASSPALTVDEAGLFVCSLFDHHIDADRSEVERIAVCSVVPHLTDIYEKMTGKYFKVEPLTISSQIKLPFEIEYSDPTAVGADRLANTAAGFAIFHEALVVVDLGTAITFDVISDKGSYLGGIIAPGPQMAGSVLAARAARLFEVRVEKPDRTIGKTTAEAIKSGLYLGTVGMIDHILDCIFKELGGKTPAIATGGEAEIFVSGSRHITRIKPTLTLEGIRIISDLN